MAEGALPIGRSPWSMDGDQGWVGIIIAKFSFD